MTLTNEQYEKLMRFMDADMSMEEMEVFEKELDVNSDLRQQLDFELSVRDGFQYKINNKEPELDNKPGNGKNNLTAVAVKKNVYSRWKFAAAAAACLVIILSSLFLFNKKKSDNPVAKHIDTLQQNKNDIVNVAQTPDTNKLLPVVINTDSLFNKYYTKESVPGEYPMLLADAFDNYEKGNYSAFEHLDISNIQTRGGADENEKILTMGNFYKGITALENNKTEKAVEYFKQVLLYAKDDIWKEKAHWYLALGHLKSNNKNAAIVQLNQVVNTSFYNKKAKQILKLLKL